MEQLINDIIAWMSGMPVTIDALRDFLKSKGLSEEEITYIIGQLLSMGFSIINDIVTYRGMNYRAPLPPSQH